jgi:hypothetical protein
MKTTSAVNVRLATVASGAPHAPSRKPPSACRQEIFSMPASLPKCAWCFSIAIALLVSALFAQQVVAPSSAGASFGPPPYYGYGGVGYGWGGGFGDWGAGSTVAGSYLSGMGQAIRAEGQYNLMSSEAAINLEEAQKRDIENRALWTNTYFEMRRINKANRFAKKSPPRTQDDWARMAAEAAPKRLNSTELDPITGVIHWPAALEGPKFSKDRDALDQLFHDRAQSDGAIGMADYKKIRATVNSALDTLKKNIRDLDVRYYTQAKRFLTGLAREADFPAG